MSLPSSVPVVVIGAGPVGLCAANLLGTYGVPCLVLERRRVASVLPRAILVDDEAMRTLQAVGLDEAFSKLVTPGRGARYYDENGEPFAEVGAGPRNFGFAKRAHFFQPDLEALLLGALRERHETALGSAALFGHQVVGVEQDAGGVTLRVVDRRDSDADADAARDAAAATVRAEFVLGCDGARSFVRGALGVAMEGDNYPEEWAILDMNNDPDQEAVSKFHCRTDRPYVSVVGPPDPQGGGLGRRYEFRARPGVDTAEAMADPEKAAAALLKGIRPVAPGDVSRAAVYSFEAKLAARWQEGRAFLLGDAAHLTPPFAGQGMNTGIRDAHNLAWKIAACVAARRGRQAGPALLGSYEQERRGPAWSMVQLAVAMGEIVMPQGAAEVGFRSRMIAYMDRFPAARDYVVGMKFKPPPSYSSGAFAAGGRGAFAGSLLGHMLPQPPVLWGAPAGAAASAGPPRLDDVMGAGFALIAQQASTAADMVARRHELWPELAPTMLLLSDEEDAQLPGGDAQEGAVAALRPDWTSEHAALPMSAMRAHRDQVLLVRPDRFVAAAFWPGDVASVRETVAAFRHAMGSVAPAPSPARL